MGTWVSFHGGKTAVAWPWPLTLSSAEVKERVPLLPSGPSWPVLEWLTSVALHSNLSDVRVDKSWSRTSTSIILFTNCTGTSLYCTVMLWLNLQFSRTPYLWLGLVLTAHWYSVLPQPEPTGLCNGEDVCFLRLGNWAFKQIVDRKIRHINRNSIFPERILPDPWLNASS